MVKGQSRWSVLFTRARNARELRDEVSLGLGELQDDLAMDVAQDDTYPENIPETSYELLLRKGYSIEQINNMLQGTTSPKL